MSYIRLKKWSHNSNVYNAFDSKGELVGRIMSVIRGEWSYKTFGTNYIRCSSLQEAVVNLQKQIISESKNELY